LIESEKEFLDEFNRTLEITKEDSIHSQGGGKGTDVLCS
jgi:hypothetical protein